MKHLSAFAFLVSLVALAPASAEAQLADLVSPGRLAKAHASLEGVANCQKCHEAGKRVVADKCLACHRPIADRIRMKKGVHANAGGDCVTCHVEHAGADAELRPFDQKSFDHAGVAGYPLDGRHAAVQCESCHKTRSFLSVKPTCASCHSDVHKGQLGAECSRCHATTFAFKETRQRFDHGRTAFPLAGAHRKIECATCHPNGRYVALKTGATSAAATGPGQCASCHKTPHRAPLGPACSTCHTSDTWKTQKVEHARTGFPLKGLHAKVECASCHKQAAARVPLKSQKCADCHSDPHAGRFKQDCASCHNERGFGGAPFDHANQTRFALSGAHAKLVCASCHKPQQGGVASARRTGAPASVSGRTTDFRGLTPDCASCHRDVHRGEAGAECRACHGTGTFHDVKYVHKTAPEFFGGNHAALPCAKCHTALATAPPKKVADGLYPLLERMPRLMLTSSRGLQLVVPRGQSVARAPDVQWRFKGVTTECASCHRDPHLGQLGSTCGQCHAVSAAKFAAVKFSHAASAFKLDGKHQAVECAKCHKVVEAAFPAGQGSATRYKGMGTQCASCHQDTHLGQLGKKCELCHTTGAFQIPGYTHLLRPEMSRGKHLGVECRACHKREEADFPDGRGVAIRFAGFPKGCASCHNDVHKGSMGGTCETCHSVESFRTISRAFHKGGTFALEGQHLNVPCASCHVNGQIKGTPSTCYDCHWQRRQDDRYQLRLGRDCETCHRPVSWTATRWSHVAATGVALNATHRILGCDSCHRRLEFRKDIGVDCASCHAPEYQQTRAPAHVAAGFPMSCEACHRPSDPDWHRATFDHNARFPLVGTHAQVQCAVCHRGNVYIGTPRDCVGCHQAEYQATKNPNHAAAGFPTNCETCHRATDQDWHRAILNHDQFFRLDGQHRVAQCMACHGTGVYRGTPRECVACHRTNYEGTRAPNHAAAGFPTDCQQCHRSSDPDWHQATFNHDSAFRLEGDHRAVQCATCHVNGRFKGTPTQCVSCHQAQYNQTRSPNHGAAGFGTNCETCHRASDSSWNQGRFNHTFPIAGPHRVACSQCHLDTSNYRAFSCTVCHERGKTDGDHKGEAGYRYDSQACFACHPNGKH